MTTIADIARRAGVGVGTVSRVLNRSPLVSDTTRARVLAVIEELQYTPSSVARRLSLGQTLTVAVVVPFLTRPSAVERLRGIVRALRETQYDIVVFDVESPSQRLEQMRAVIGGDRSDGTIIVSLRPTDEEVARLEENRVRAVLVDASHHALPRIVIDDVAGGRLATRHLLELGHTHVAFVGDPPESPFGFTSSEERYEGYVQELAAAGLDSQTTYVRKEAHASAVAHELARDLLSARHRPTAVFAASDTQAFGVLEAAAGLGLEVPAELSVIGFDDIDSAAYLGLTTVRQPLFDSGRRGGELLLGLLRGASPDPIRTLLPLELVMRRTTGPPG